MLFGPFYFMITENNGAGLCIHTKQALLALVLLWACLDSNQEAALASLTEGTGNPYYRDVG
jgi:hypothetical protein